MIVDTKKIKKKKETEKFIVLKRCFYKFLIIKPKDISSTQIKLVYLLYIITIFCQKNINYFGLL